MKKGQVTLELTISIMLVIILFAGMVGVCFWTVRSIVGRHNAYRNTPYNSPGRFYTPPNADIVPDLVR